MHCDINVLPPPLLVYLSSMDSKISQGSVQFASAGWIRGPVVSLSVWSLLSWTSGPAAPPFRVDSQNTFDHCLGACGFLIRY